VAVLRASGDPEKLAHQPLKLSRQLEYVGRLYPTNRSRAAILDWSYRPDLSHLDETLLHQAPGRQRPVGALGRPSWFAAAQAELLAECNINPVRLRQSGCLALDCLLVLREPIERNSA
jgi:hypothetical protein